MKVTLINYTANAVELLLFTKATRLNMTPSLLEEIHDWPEEKKMEELEYMANTIPSSWEFVDYVFLVEGVTRAYTHQQVRTRSASYAQQSLRVVDASEFEYVFTGKTKDNNQARASINQTVSAIRTCYTMLTKSLGIPAEDARGILPINTAGNIVCKFNLRTFVELCRSREGGRTQEEYRDVVRGMTDAVIEVHPWAQKFLFGDVGRNYFDEIEQFAHREFGSNLIKKGELLKIVDKMRKEQR